MHSSRASEVQREIEHRLLIRQGRARLRAHEALCVATAPRDSELREYIVTLLSRTHLRFDRSVGVGAKREPFAHLFEPRDPLNDRMVHTMLAGYRLIEQFVCDAVDPFLRVAKINARSAEFLKAHAEARYLLTAMRT